MFSFTFADDHRRALTAAMKSPTAGIHVTLLAVSLAVLLVAITYQPLPEDFPQPWKYRFLSYWAHRVDQLVSGVRVRFRWQARVVWLRRATSASE